MVYIVVKDFTGLLFGLLVRFEAGATYISFIFDLYYTGFMPLQAAYFSIDLCAYEKGL